LTGPIVEEGDGGCGPFDRLAALLPIGFSRRDPAGHLTFANAAWRRMAGVGDGPLSTEAWRQAIHPEDRARVAAGWAAALADGRPLRLDYRVRRAGGATRWLAEGAVAECDVAGECLGFVGTLTDTTDARELEARLGRSRRLEALGQLTGSVAHDFNNLLMIVLANAEILDEVTERGEALPAERVRRIARTLFNAADRGAGLTRTLLGFARSRDGQVEGRSESVALNRHLAGLGDLLRRSLGATVSLAFDLAAEPDLVEIDPIQFDIAMINLALNARDAMPEGGAVVLATARRADGIAVSLTDTGSGMAPEVAARAVEPFFTHGRPAERGGMGLSIVQSVIERAGGTLRIETASRQGTAVTLLLPASRAEAVQRDPVPAVLAGAAGLRLLVVADLAPVLAVMAGQAARLGFAVATAATAEAALARLDAGERFDLLLSDIELGPGRDGVSLAREAKARFPHLGILLTTGNPLGPVGESRAGDVAPVLLKPFSQRQLAVALNRLLGAAGT